MSDGMGDGRVGAPVGGKDVGGGWRAFFWVAAAFNFVVGALAMLSPVATVDGRIVGLLVFNFGIIYMLVAREPQRFAPTLWAGVIGKLGVVGLLGPQAMSGVGGTVGQTAIVIVLALDAVFAIGFLVFLMTKSDASQSD